MKDLFFLILSCYLLSLLFGSLAAVVRFWIDVKKFHPKETKEPKFSKREFEKSIKEQTAAPDPDESEVLEDGRDEHNTSAVL